MNVLQHSAKTNVLPKGVQALAAPSESRPKRRKVVVFEDYASVDGEVIPDSGSDSDDEKPVAPPPALPSDEPHAKCASDQGLVDQLVERQEQLTKQLGDRADELRDILLAGRLNRGSFAERKHHYTQVAQSTPAFANSGTEYATCITNISEGTGVSDRLTNTIKIHKIRFRLSLTRASVAQSTNIPLYPEITCMMIRDKLPVSVSSFPTMFATDTNPPSGVTNYFSRLGAAQLPGTDRTAVVNPVAYDRYHVYRLRRINTETMNGDADNYVGANGTTFGRVTAKIHQMDWTVHCHGVTVQYGDGAGLSGTVNPIWFMIRSDFAGTTNETANGFTFSYTWTADVEFEDVLE